MKKRIFTLLLAVCLIAGMLPVIASAEAGNQAYFQLPGADENGDPKALAVIIDEGGAAQYFLTDDKGVVTSTGASADNYNVKIEYAAGGTPTVYLKGANIYSTGMSALQIGRLAATDVEPILDFAAVINVESDSTLIGSSNPDEGAYQSGITIVSSETCTFTGAGKLTVKSEESTVIHTYCELIFKDANVDISSDMTRGGQRAAIHSEKNGRVIFDNTDAIIYANTGPCIWVHESYYQPNDPQQRDVIFKNGSNVSMSNDQQSEAVIGTKGQLLIDNSDVEITAFGALFDPKPVITNATAVGGKKKTKTEAYDEAKVRDYGYFKSTAGSGSSTPDATQPTTPNATQPTTPNATQPTTPNATQPTTPNATQPTTPNATQPAKPDASNPTTGDNFNIVLLTALLLVSAAGVVVIGKKKFA